MRISRLMKLSLIVLLMYMLMIPASTNYVQSAQNYEWNNIPIGGGGYVTGVVIHPTEPDLVYARTDVGGAYRLDVTSGDWVPLLDHFGDEDSNLYGVDGIALDQQNPNVVYIAAGKYGNVGPSDILKSTDRGETWIRTGLNLRNESNGNIHRAMGRASRLIPRTPITCMWVHDMMDCTLPVMVQPHGARYGMYLADCPVRVFGV